ncbi:hypothetical protein [Robertmurraya korlensis]|uniref:hypothetical protein n=1 Tax=Robertmurraya korlensis TaxID=519977 RepID=UPI00082711CC|nr:hypothetical protein [Robertmurraya korlensis]
MTTKCEICNKDTKERVSYLELETWEFDFLKKQNKLFYSICFSCFDKHTNQFIDKETDLELRKKRLSLVSKEIQDEIEDILAIEV